MPYKPGGANHLQYYDATDGQYSDEEKSKMNNKDLQTLVMYYIFGVANEGDVFHFPNTSINSKEYCEEFVKYSRSIITNVKVDDEKIDYLLKYSSKNDKSKFLNNIGFNSLNKNELIKAIVSGTDHFTITYCDYQNDCLKCKAKTIINKKIVTTIWQLNLDFSIRLITMIPGGENEWK